MSLIFSDRASRGLNALIKRNGNSRYSTAAWRYARLSAKAVVSAPVEMRMLSITLAKPGITDLTIAFKARNQIADCPSRCVTLAGC
jgi:hypothetical protein